MKVKTRNRSRPWTEAAALKAAADACDALELSAKTLDLVRLGSAANFRLGDVVLRLAAPGTPLSQVERERDFAELLERVGVPAVKPLPVAPVELGGAIVSLWRYVDHDPARRVPSKAFGQLLREMHDALDAAKSKLRVPKFDGGQLLAAKLDWLESAETLDGDDVELLRDRAEDVLRRLRKVRSELGEGLIHGDAHLDNVVVGPLGPVLLDFERVCRGPREWDLIPTALRLERFGGSEREWDGFCQGYGYDVRAWSGYEACRDLRALSVSLFTMVHYARHRQEAEKRLRYWRRPTSTAPAWSAV